MRCPSCEHAESKVIDSRTAGDAIRRRRECLSCTERFTTFERMERRLPWVRKKTGRKEPFSREKVLHGLMLACRKRPIEEGQLEDMVRDIEARLETAKGTEVDSDMVGQVVMEVLRGVDDVAYVRFASVYQNFESVEQFRDAIQPLSGPQPGQHPVGGDSQ